MRERMLRTHRSSDLKNANSGDLVTVAGWVHEIRDISKLVFVVIRDREGFVQATGKAADLGDRVKEFANLSRESVVSITGRAVVPSKAKVGPEIAVESWSVLSNAAAPLPLGPADKVNIDPETRFDHRALDIRRPEISALFKFRSDLMRTIRGAMTSRGFLEMTSPKLVAAGAEGGATLFKVDYFGKTAYLAQSPQLYKQMLMGAGLDRVFELTPAFRAEPSDTTRHISEFTSFDGEMAFIDGLEDVLQALEGTVAEVMKNLESKFELKLKTPELPIPRVRYEEAVKIAAARGFGVRENEDLPTDAEKALGEEMKARGHDFYFITHYPHAAKPFYIMEEGTLSRGYDLECNGLEIASGGQREHRHEELTKRMEAKGLDVSSFSYYLEPFKYGMPPHGGWGFGVERFAAALIGQANVREMIMFPRDRGRLVP
ncbi:MAG TPA: aspartate--tRNA(Asn) ligase [Thermoplasmata archaeon]|nr:aspartate--tRNA(Asn) ligase [Thermoplasmata archaeon]